MLNRDEKIANEIIKPKNDLIKELYTENVSLHKELSKQTVIIDKAEKFEKERKILEKNNSELQTKYRDLEINLTENEKKLKYKYEDEIYQIDYRYQKIINKLEKDNNYLKKIIDRFKITVERFITWVCHKFSVPSEEALIRDFEKETDIDINLERPLDVDKFEIVEEDEQEYEIY